MARATTLFGLALRFLGLAAFLYAAALLAWQAFTFVMTGAWVALPTRVLVDAAALHAPKLASLAPFVPGVDWAWANHPHSLRLLNRLLGVLLDRVHLSLFVAALGYGLMELGAYVVACQAARLERQASARADRRRRIAQYAVRVEPVDSYRPILPEDELGADLRRAPRAANSLKVS